MDSDFQTKLKNVLSDPEALAKISAIASSIGANSQSNDTASASEPISAQSDNTSAQNGIGSPLDSVPAIAQSFMPQQSDPRLQLLYSIKPLLREDKRDKIDALTRALTVASMMKAFRK